MKSIRELAPGFLEANTDAAFMLLTARFYVMAADGKVQEAVPFARSHLAPLVRDSAARTDQMKVSLLKSLCDVQPFRTQPLFSAGGGQRQSTHSFRLRCVRCPAADGIAGECAECADRCPDPGRLRRGPAQLRQLLQHQRHSHRGPGSFPGPARPPAGAAVAGMHFLLQPG